MNTITDVAKGSVDSLGVLFLWTNDPAEIDNLLTFDDLTEMINYVSKNLDTFNITFEQGLQKRLFTIWQMPWNDAPGPEGEPWTTLG